MNKRWNELKKELGLHSCKCGNCFDVYDSNTCDHKGDSTHDPSIGIIRVCEHCGVAFCIKCGKEWGGKEIQYVPYYVTPYILQPNWIWPPPYSTVTIPYTISTTMTTNQILQ